MLNRALIKNKQHTSRSTYICHTCTEFMTQTLSEEQLDGRISYADLQNDTLLQKS